MLLFQKVRSLNRRSEKFVASFLVVFLLACLLLFKANAMLWNLFIDFSISVLGVRILAELPRQLTEIPAGYAVKYPNFLHPIKHPQHRFQKVFIDFSTLLSQAMF